MALRLIEMVLRERDGAEVRELLKEHKMLEHRQIRLPDGEVLMRILLDAERNEAVLDLLEKRYAGVEGNRVVILPVVATLPRPEPEPAAAPGQPASEGKPPERISREELYEDIKNAARSSRVYLAMTVLSTVVAAIGLLYNSVAIIIGAMVIAPLLGPNVALALGTTLGDLSLLRRAGVHDGGVGDVDRRDGGVSVIAAAGGVRAAAGRRASGAGAGRVVAVSGELDLREPGRRDNVFGAGHSPAELVGEKSGRESYAYRHWTVGGTAGGVGRHDSPVAEGLNMLGQEPVESRFLSAAGRAPRRRQGHDGKDMSMIMSIPPLTIPAAQARKETLHYGTQR
jgi:hypothetical protein